MRRALLTSLLLQAGQFVSARQLRDMLWDEPPPSAPANLRSHFTGLRGDLDRAEAGLHGRIETLRERGGGYRVRVHNGELDLHTFTAAARRGRAALLQGRLDTAIEALEAATHTWDGPFGEGLPQTRWFTAHCAGINSARLTAYQDLYACYVLAGRHDNAYQIERTIADGPYRERLWELLVAVHFLGGDPASALAAVSRCRRTFSEHLGLDAPPGIFLLQKAVLNWDADEVHRLIEASACRG
jgi:DNA-binding SARP family transcriptional activator